jgi:transcriptional repressor NrdR
VGLAILGPLRELDEVAYLRFASVYRSFQSLNDFEDEIVALRAKRPGQWRPEDEQFPARGDARDPDGGEQPPASPAPAGRGRPAHDEQDLPIR